MSLFIVLRNVTGNYSGISGSVKLLHKPCKLSCTNACQRSRRSYASPEFPFVFVLVCREFVSFLLLLVVITIFIRFKIPIYTYFIRKDITPRPMFTLLGPRASGYRVYLLFTLRHRPLTSFGNCWDAHLSRFQ